MWAAVAALLLLAAAPARAQTAKPGAATEAAAAASAAMERAKRQAAGPMRVILEASRTRRKAVDAEVPAAAPESITRSVAVVPTSVPASAQPSAQPTAQPAAPPAVPPPAAPGAALGTAPPSGVLTQITLTSETLQGKAAARVPGLEVGGPASTAPLPAAAGLASLPVVPNTVIGPGRVKLLNRVDPELPQRQLDDLGRNATVTVDLTIRVDGSVGKVALVPPVPRGVQRAVLAALEQWRFEPLPGERVHRVQLIFNPEQ